MHGPERLIDSNQVELRAFMLASLIVGQCCLRQYPVLTLRTLVIDHAC